jgi:sugar lactone lactonase YvrE
VSRFDGRNWTTYTAEDGLADNRVMAVVVDGKGALWFGTSGGVSRFDGQTWTTYTAEDGLASDWVSAIAMDREGALWFGTDGGVSRFDGQTWTTYTEEDGLADNWVRAVAVDGEGALWLGTGGRVSRFDGHNWTTYTTEDGLARNRVYAIAVGGEGALWFGTGGGVSRFDGDSWTTYTTKDGLADNWVYAITVDRKGALWFSTRGGGVSRFDGQTWTTYTEEDGLANNRVEAIAVDREGALWFGTDGGVSRFSGDNWTTYTAEDDPRAWHRIKAAQKRGTVLHKYEQPFISLLEDHAGVPVLEIDFGSALKQLVKHVAMRVEGFDLSDTQDYYRQIIRRALQEAQAIEEIPEREKALDRDFEWILLDDDYPTVFEADDHAYRPVWMRPIITAGHVARSAASGKASVPARPAPGGRTTFGDVAASFAGWAEHTMGSMASAIAPGSLQVARADGGVINLSGVDDATGDLFVVIADILESSTSGGGGGGGGGGGCACAGCACACACAGGGR